jgi:N4-gp56 family major capsid protein
MAINIKSGIGSNYLQTKLFKTLLENFEPNLYFYKMGEKPMVDNGIGTVSWAKASKLTVTASTATLTEGVTPLSTAFTYTVITSTPTQYGIFVEISDRLLKAAPTKIINDAGKEVGNNMARIVDQVIQTEIMAGTNVQYSVVSVNTVRTDLATTDIATGAVLRNAHTKLASLDAPTIGGYYLGVAHPFVIGDLQAESNGAWIEFSKYTTPDKLFKGEIGALYGVRLVSCSNVQTFASTTTVYPTLVMGAGAYGVTEWASLETIYKPLGSGADPLNQVASVGAKVDFSAKRLQEDAMVRIETAATAV